MDLATRLQELIISAVESVAEKFAISELPVLKVELMEPPQKQFGDYSVNVAMQLAKTFKTSPRELAKEIIAEIHHPMVRKIEIAGPGFINLYLNNEWVYDLLRTVFSAGPGFGNAEANSKERVQIEYVSANPTGPLHVGHGRGAAVGSVLVNIMKAAGYNVSSEHYVNDAGNQIDNLAISVNARYLQLLGIAVEFPEDGYHGEDILGTAQRIIDRDGDKHLAYSEVERLKVFKELAYQEKLQLLKEDLEKFGVTFDVWFSEKMLHEANEVNVTIEQLKRLEDKTYFADGAMWLRSTLYGDDKDRVLVRSNGMPTYLTPDIAYHNNKFKRGFDRIIDILGADHHGYMARMKAAMAAIGYDPERLEILLLQMVRLFRGGELVKLSKRTGKNVTLLELIDEVGKDAARYFFVMRSTDSQLDFDVDLAVSKSSDNPVFYIQYAHARICSVLRQLEELNIMLPVIENVDLTLLNIECEHELIKKMAQYPQEIEYAARLRAPHVIARYAFELASLFHVFYNQCRIIGADSAAIRDARIILILATQNIIRHNCAMLGVSAPERM
ncbi:MAG: arginine--tRNA ligase [Negativicutes bacterium]|jgi:arginyl-tRNA synthetase